MKVISELLAVKNYLPCSIYMYYSSQTYEDEEQPLLDILLTIDKQQRQNRCFHLLLLGHG